MQSNVKKICEVLNISKLLNTLLFQNVFCMEIFKMRADVIIILRILWYFHFYWRNSNYMWGVGHYCKCKKDQIKQYYAKSFYGTDSAPLKNPLKHFLSAEARSLCLRNPADTKE